MSQFALFYDDNDLSAIKTAFQQSGLDAADRAAAISWLNAGLASITKTAAPVEWQTSPGDITYVIVINDLTRNATDFLTYLRVLATKYGSDYMNAIADDIQSALDQPDVLVNCGCKDPYP